MRKRHRHTLVYPKHALKPQDVLDFIYMDGFAADWKRLGLSEVDLIVLRVVLMSAPRGWPVIPGTGGLRKARFAPESWNTGKSGAARICYVYFKSSSLILLVKAYSKHERANLSSGEKAQLKQTIQRIRHRLSRGPIK